MRIIDNITLLTANYNSMPLTMKMLRSFIKQTQHIIPMYIIDNSTRNVYPLQYAPYLHLIDNYNHGRSGNLIYPSPNHCNSIEYALQFIRTRYVLLCDNDILFKPDISKLLHCTEGQYDAYGEIGTDGTTYCPPVRLFPYMCIFDLHKKRAQHIKYFDKSRMLGMNSRGVGGKPSYDTGASFTEDIVRNKWNIKQIKLTQYITHLKGHSVHNIDATQWLKNNKSLYQ